MENKRVHQRQRQRQSRQRRDMLRTSRKYRTNSERRDMPRISHRISHHERWQHKDPEYRRKSFGAHQEPRQGGRGTTPAMARKWAVWQYDRCCVGGSTTSHRRGLNQPWPTSAHMGYITPTVQWGPQRFRAVGRTGSGRQVGIWSICFLWSKWVSNAIERWRKSAIGHTRTNWRHHSCHLGRSPSVWGGGENWPPLVHARRPNLVGD